MARRGYLRTAEVAHAVGCHPNTVRLYEEWGFLPPIPRTPSGYRMFTPEHRDQMHLARTALQGPWPGRQVKDVAVSLVRRSAGGDLGGALEEAYRYRSLVQAERVQAESAAEMLSRWADGVAADVTLEPVRIGRAASLLGLTADALRNWERDGLIVVPRDPSNGYRLYTAAELGRLRVVRVLKRAGYSHTAVLRMLLHLDRGETGDLVQVLDTPRPDEDAWHAADRWLSTLAGLGARAADLIEQLEAMIARRATARHVARAGRAMDRTTVCRVVETVLDRASRSGSDVQVRFWGGGGALMSGLEVSGLETSGHDLGVLVRDTADAEALTAALAAFTPLGDLGARDMAAYEVYGTRVRIGVAGRLPASEWDGCAAVRCGRYEAALLSPEACLVLALNGGQGEVVAALARHLRATGCDVARLRQLCSALGLSERRESDVLRMVLDPMGAQETQE